jgi:hypothetical protein
VGGQTKREDMRGSCHRCGTSSDRSSLSLCALCGCKFHDYDCGAKLQEAGLLAEDAADCPRCTSCQCWGAGPMVCHVTRQRVRRGEGGCTRRGKLHAVSVFGYTQEMWDHLAKQLRE